MATLTSFLQAIWPWGVRECEVGCDQFAQQPTEFAVQKHSKDFHRYLLVPQYMGNHVHEFHSTLKASRKCCMFFIPRTVLVEIP